VVFLKKCFVFQNAIYNYSAEIQIASLKMGVTSRGNKGQVPETLWGIKTA